ncbi:amidohydrolase family protein [Ruminococcaceae bacterium OttesenSCG-928-D13]|nr:amidohydrolase family protein [Ruminococcaceae bacterium OttesenSCG-928-D13]
MTLSPSHPADEGKMLLDIAAERGITLIDALFDVLHDDRFETLCVMHSMSEDDVENLMVWRRTMIGSDGLFAPGGRMAHPRCYGTFPRFLGRYARDKALLPPEEAIRKITAMPAAVYGLSTKGLIRVGMDADLTLFDEKALIDNADYQNFNAKNSGIAKVFVNGTVVVEDNLYNGRMPGRLLRK